MKYYTVFYAVTMEARKDKDAYLVTGKKTFSDKNVCGDAQGNVDYCRARRTMHISRAFQTGKKRTFKTKKRTLKSEKRTWKASFLR